MSKSVEERIAAFTQAVEQAGQQKDRLDLMADEIKGIEAVETSPDRSVTVTTGASGAVKSVKISEAAMTKSAQALSQQVHQTLQLGLAKAARMQAEIIQKYVGDSTKIVEKVGKLQEDLLNPQTNEGFQIHRDTPGDVDSVMVTHEHAAPPRPSAPPAYQPPQQPGFGQPGPQQPGFGQPGPQRPVPPHPAQRPRPDYDDYDSAPGVLTRDARPSPQPSTPPPSTRSNDDEVFHFGGEDY